jgi:hypothetical protein
MDWRAIHAARLEETKKGARQTSLLRPLTDEAVRERLLQVGLTMSAGTLPLPPLTFWLMILVPVLTAILLFAQGLQRIDLS